MPFAWTVLAEADWRALLAAVGPMAAMALISVLLNAAGLEAVTGMDSSAGESFERLFSAPRKSGIGIMVAGVAPAIARVFDLERAVGDGAVRTTLTEALAHIVTVRAARLSFTTHRNIALCQRLSGRARSLGETPIDEDMASCH